jgi:hypothetical protein
MVMPRELKDYPEGTRIKIGARSFVRADRGKFWNEDHEIPGNCCSRPSASPRNIELSTGSRHIVVEGAVAANTSQAKRKDWSSISTMQMRGGK